MWEMYGPAMNMLFMTALGDLEQLIATQRVR